MTRFLIRRTLQGIFTLWVIVSLVFVLYFVAPHDPARLIAGRTVTPGLLRLIREQSGSPNRSGSSTSASSAGFSTATSASRISPTSR